ncbi:MAG: sulfatase-like hydrolase/transferase [Candidatus Firestonebacteria bacterium]|nr:sulfatase-like hydrolase/transferase [Candidatus Firestonebacteria bacterium]
MKAPKFILFITTDQQRKDTLGVYGSKVATSKNLDALAKEGTVFEKAYCNNTVCVPSRICMATGKYVHQHGVEYMEDVVDTTPGLPPWEKTFLESLKAGGVKTGAFGKLHLYPTPPKGLDEAKLTGGQGMRWKVASGSPLGPSPLGHDYAKWLEKKRPGAYESIYAQRRTPEYSKYKSAVTSVLSFEENVDYWTADNTIDFFKRNQKSDKPVFAWCGFCKPHDPFDAPEPYASMYKPEDMKIPETYMMDLSDRPGFYSKRQLGDTNGFTPEVYKRLMAYYYGLCTMTDDLCGKIFNELKKMGVWDETLVIMTTDHGEHLGEYGLFGKTTFLEPIINMPLIIKPAGGKPKVGKTTDLVELMDVAPTILEAAGVPAPESMQAESLLPVMEGKKKGKEQVLVEFTNAKKTLKGKCLRTNKYKYNIWFPGNEEELYDMEKDPAEKKNLAKDPKHAGALSDMRVRMISHLSATEKKTMGV